MAHPVTENYAKPFLGEKDIKSVLRRLDRLTLDESRLTVSQTLEIIYGLVNIIQVVMEGTHRQFVRVRVWYERPIW